MISPTRAGTGPAPSLDAGRSLAADCNAFGFDLYGQLRKEHGNLLLSPYSIAVALAMVQEGAAGATRAQLLAGMHRADDANVDGFRDLDLLLQQDPSLAIGDGPFDDGGFELSIANRLWVDGSLRLEPAYQQRAAAVFAASPEPANFGNPDRVRAAINAWASRETRGRIRNVVPPGQPTADARMALANAVYFKARWSETFEERATTPQRFHGVGTEPREVAMMRQTHHFPYGESLDAQWVELPYFGGDASMVLILPKSRDGLSKLEDALDAETLVRGLDALAHREVALEMPRFEFEASFGLAETLRALGMVDVFRPDAADLSGISSQQKLWLDAVLHKTFIKVDEEGTEAAAVTVGLVLGAAIAQHEPVPFVADHPFVFLIRHRATGAVLFLGRVVDPKGD